jgi:hypothetical protein
LELVASLAKAVSHVVSMKRCKTAAKKRVYLKRILQKSR